MTLDKFYTNQDLANKYVGKVFSLYPSAGAGSFLDALNRFYGITNTIGIDIRQCLLEDVLN